LEEPAVLSHALGEESEEVAEVGGPAGALDAVGALYAEPVL
jgi:hypothetical protein